MNIISVFFIKVRMSANYNKVISKLFFLSVALTRMDTILPVVREVTPIKTSNCRIKTGMWKWSIGCVCISNTK